MRLRKRVTKMVVTVSAIFVILRGADPIIHFLIEAGNLNLIVSALPIEHTAIMFNAAVNPFVYALINERFRKELKKMTCCLSCSCAFSRCGSEGTAAKTEMTNNIGKASNEGETKSEMQ